MPSSADQVAGLSVKHIAHFLHMYEQHFTDAVLNQTQKTINKTLSQALLFISRPHCLHMTESTLKALAGSKRADNQANRQMLLSPVIEDHADTGYQENMNTRKYAIRSMLGMLTTTGCNACAMVLGKSNIMRPSAGTFSLKTTLTVATRKSGCQEAKCPGCSKCENRTAPQSTSVFKHQYLTPY